MKAEDAEEYTQSLGQVLSGSWRQIALGIRMGAHDALNLSRDEWISRLGGHVKLSIPERREAVLELKAEGHNNSEIADVLGVGEATVRRDLENSSNGDNAEENINNINDDNKRNSPNDEVDEDEEIEPSADMAVVEAVQQGTSENVEDEALSPSPSETPSPQPDPVHHETTQDDPDRKRRRLIDHGRHAVNDLKQIGSHISCVEAAFRLGEKVLTREEFEEIRADFLRLEKLMESIQ